MADTYLAHAAYSPDGTRATAVGSFHLVQILALGLYGGIARGRDRQWRTMTREGWEIRPVTVTITPAPEAGPPEAGPPEASGDTCADGCLLARSASPCPAGTCDIAAGLRDADGSCPSFDS